MSGQMLETSFGGPLAQFLESRETLRPGMTGFAAFWLAATDPDTDPFSTTPCSAMYTIMSHTGMSREDLIG